MSEVLQDMTVKQANMTMARFNNPHTVHRMLNDFLTRGEVDPTQEVAAAVAEQPEVSFAEYLGGYIVRQSAPKRIDYARVTVEGILVNKASQAIEFSGIVEITVSRVTLKELAGPIQVVPFHGDLQKLKKSKSAKQSIKLQSVREGRMAGEHIPDWMTGDELPEPEMPEIAAVRQEHLEEWQRQVADGQCIVGLIEWYARRGMNLPIPTPRELEL